MESNKKSEINAPKSCRKRILTDVIQIMKSPLTSNGIYYKHDENNLMKGYAMIIGPEDTPYENGMYFFNFDFNINYPYKPPKLTYMTNGDNIRFNPNLYRTGKVCLSLLNTWRGEQWTSCQTISSILLTLVSILHNKPLINEPGINEFHYDFDKYNKIVRWGANKVAILYVMRGVKFEFFNELFGNEISNHLKTNKTHIIESLKELKKERKTTYKTALYCMTTEIDYKILFKEIKAEFKKLKI